MQIGRRVGKFFRLHELQTVRNERTVTRSVSCVHHVFLLRRLHNIVGGVGGGRFHIYLFQVSTCGASKTRRHVRWNGIEPITDRVYVSLKEL